MALVVLVDLALCLSPFAYGQEPSVGFTKPPAAETVVLPKSVPDPIEPFNRVMWDFNKGLMTGVIKPTSKVYRFVVVKPVRTGIGNFGKNLTYPGRLINNLLQGKWRGARDESYRFVCNTTVGVAGVFDVASKWKIPKSDTDFGQTFGQWGWKPNFFLMLPFLGPSNDRDTVGWAADTAANPLLYISSTNSTRMIRSLTSAPTLISPTRTCITTWPTRWTTMCGSARRKWTRIPRFSMPGRSCERTGWRISK